MYTNKSLKDFNFHSRDESAENINKDTWGGVLRGRL